MTKMNRNKTRRTIAAALCLLTLCAFGCEKADQIESEAVAPDEEASELEEPTDMGGMVGIANPMTGMTAEELAEKTGFTLTPPEGASDVRYFTLKGGSAQTAQMDFTLNGREFTYRVTPTSETEAADTTGLYYTWEQTEEAEVGRCTGTLNLGKEAAGLYWLDVVPGVNYSLSCIGSTTEDEMRSLAETLFAPVQGEAG